MDKIRMKKDELLSILKENRKKHKQEYKEAIRAFRLKAVDTFNREFEKATNVSVSGYSGVSGCIGIQGTMGSSGCTGTPGYSSNVVFTSNYDKSTQFDVTFADDEVED